MYIEKIASRQLFFILFMMRTTVIIAFLPVLTTADAFQDAWLSAILSFFGSAILIFIIASLGLRYPEKTIIEYSIDLLGPWGGKILSILFLWALLHIAATDVRIYAEVIITAFLTETPLFFIITTMVTAGAIAAYAGIETIGRAADFLFPLYLLMIITTLVVPLPELPPGLVNFEPVLSRGLLPVFRGAITPVFITANFVVLTILIPSTTQPKRTVRVALLALAGSSLVLIASVFSVISILGAEHAAKKTFPVFFMIQSVQISEFLERFEVLITFAWGFGLFIGVGTFLFCGAKGLSQVLGLKTYRPLIAPMAVIWIALSKHLFQNVFQMRTFLKPQVIAPYILSLIVLPALLLWAVYGLKKTMGGLKDE